MTQGNWRKGITMGMLAALLALAGCDNQAIKELEEGVVRGSIDWRCGDPDPKLGTMEANDFITGGPRLHPNGDARAGAVLAEGRQ